MAFSGISYRDREAPVVVLGPIQMMEIQPSMIHLHLLSYEYPIPASLEGDIAQELSLSLNGALCEKLVYVWDAPDAYNAYTFGNAVGIIE